MSGVVSCPVCGYFLQEPTTDYQKLSCPMCHEPLVASTISAVTVPTSVVVGTVCFVAGMILGPTMLAATREGSRWLEEMTRRKLSPR